MVPRAVCDDELRAHGANADDVWVTVCDTVYDITALLGSHPGGKQPLLACAGGDATQLFEAAGHSKAAYARLASMKIGSHRQTRRLAAAPPQASTVRLRSPSEAVKPFPDHPPLAAPRSFSRGQYVEMSATHPDFPYYRWPGRIVSTTKATVDLGYVIYVVGADVQVCLSATCLRPYEPRTELITVRKQKSAALGLRHVGGTRAAGVVDGSPAADSGLGRCCGRYLLSVNGIPVRTEPRAGLHDFEAEETLQIEVGHVAPHAGDYVHIPRADGKPGVQLARCKGVRKDGAVVAEDIAGNRTVVPSGDCNPVYSPSAGTVESPAMWHAVRRGEMLAQHPEIENLPGHNVWSLGIAAMACLVHLLAALYCRHAPAWAVFAAASTVGAECKMLQFAMAHEFCHGVVSPALAAPAARQWAIFFCTLPSLGSGLFNYYAQHHLGHHALLGSQAFAEAATSFLGGDEMDGDLLHTYTAQLRKVVWELMQRNDVSADAGPVSRFPAVLRPAAKVVRDATIQVGHLGVVLFWNSFCGVSYLLCNLVSLVSRRPLADVLRTSRRAGQTAEAHDVGRHALTWLALAILLGWGTLAAFARVVAYLALSELFLSGFLLHPFGAYFIGVHRTAAGVDPLPLEDEEEAGDARAEGKQACQPTQSCYASPLFTYLTCFLTHHVEHHDFPHLPWSSLARVRAVCPEFYARLATLPPPVATMYEYLHSDQPWTYACTC
ncbi:Cytochrome b5 [Diplonema papillatum]|nr:Cytochrome b5 [Diplonema papillatum]